MTSMQTTTTTAAGAVPDPRAAQALPGRPFPLGATPGEQLGIAGTNFAIASSVADSPCACSMGQARKPRSRCRITTPSAGTSSCRASARDSPTGTA